MFFLSISLIDNVCYFAVMRAFFFTWNIILFSSECVFEVEAGKINRMEIL